MKSELSSCDQVDYMDSETLAHGIKRRMSSSDERESDVMASDELGVVTVEVVAGADDTSKKVKVSPIGNWSSKNVNSMLSHFVAGARGSSCR